MNFNNAFPWMTFVVVVIAIVVVLIGGISVITGHLEFQAYLDDLGKFGIGVGLVGLGRGVNSGLKSIRR